MLSQSFLWLENAWVFMHTEDPLCRGRLTLMWVNWVPPSPCYSHLIIIIPSENIIWLNAQAISGLPIPYVCSVHIAYNRSYYFLFLYLGKLLELSPQQLIDCAGTPADHGCQGGNLFETLQWLNNSKQPVVLEKMYPYKGKNGNCKRFNRWDLYTVL